MRWKNVLLGMYGSINLARKRPALREGRYHLKLVRQELGPTTTSRPTSRRQYNPWDQRLCLVPDADLFAAIRSGSVSIVTDQIERFTETGVRLRVGPGPRGGCYRHGDGPDDALDGRHRPHGRRRAGRPRQDAQLQGHDVQRRPESRIGVRLHECIVDA
jgi:cation diffusion facilitator CzcD-associated flavoprotein CzcO